MPGEITAEHNFIWLEQLNTKFQFSQKKNLRLKVVQEAGTSKLILLNKKGLEVDESGKVLGQKHYSRSNLVELFNFLENQLSQATLFHHTTKKISEFDVKAIGEFKTNVDKLFVKHTAKIASFWRWIANLFKSAKMLMATINYDKTVAAKANRIELLANNLSRKLDFYDRKYLFELDAYQISITTLLESANYADNEFQYLYSSFLKTWQAYSNHLPDRAEAFLAKKHDPISSLLFNQLQEKLPLKQFSEKIKKATEEIRKQTELSIKAELKSLLLIKDFEDRTNLLQRGFQHSTAILNEMRHSRSLRIQDLVFQYTYRYGKDAAIQLLEELSKPNLGKLLAHPTLAAELLCTFTDSEKLSAFLDMHLIATKNRSDLLRFTWLEQELSYEIELTDAATKEKLSMIRNSLQKCRQFLQTNQTLPYQELKKILHHIHDAGSQTSQPYRHAAALILNPLFRLVDRPEKIKKLNLSDFNLRALPVEIVRFSNITTINASHNHLIDFPENLNDCPDLKHLSLADNQINSLTGNGVINQLISLNLAGNQLNAFPEISSGSPLVELNLSDNQFHQFPEEVCSLDNLENLRLAKNELIELPEDWGDLNASLKVLDVSENKIESVSSITSLFNLETLIADQNKISSLPEQLSAQAFNLLSFEKNVLKELPELEAGSKLAKSLRSINISCNEIKKDSCQLEACTELESCQRPPK